jgi:hypothetical protein
MKTKSHRPVTFVEVDPAVEIQTLDGVATRVWQRIFAIAGKARIHD